MLSEIEIEFELRRKIERLSIESRPDFYRNGDERPSGSSKQVKSFQWTTTIEIKFTTNFPRQIIN